MSEHYKPIEGYGIIGNTRTAALVGFDGSIDWCCMPRFDSPSIFGSLLDWRKGGKWTIQPSGEARATQVYVHDTNILKTNFETMDAKVSLTDFMPCSFDNEAWFTPPEIHRVVRGIDGEMELRFICEPVFNYGRNHPHFARHPAGLSITNPTHEMVLSSPLQFKPTHTGVDTTLRIKKGDEKSFVLSYGEATPRRIQKYHTEKQQSKTKAFWRGWVSQLKYKGKWRDMVIRSALTLKLLVYTPTGAMVAASTTSLPEVIGGSRNWDYRYSWIRDSASSLWAFYLLGYRSETEAYLHWLIDNNPALDLDQRLLYDVAGSSKIDEVNLDHLEGYKGSRPVRIGNAAAKQLQLDAYGYMLDAIYFSSRHGVSVDDEMYFRFVKPLANYIVERWDTPSHGIWEIRSKMEEYVYTRAWCWAGLDRAVKIARATRHEEDIHQWNQVKTKIKEEVMSKGWSNEKRSFVMHYGGTDLDAANLMLPLMGFIAAGNKKMRLTVRAIEKELSKGALVFRRRDHEGTQREEGAFLLCGFWLVACLAKMGELEHAMKNLNELISHANHLGLFAEEVDPETGEALGNFPQAFSHMGLILAALTLDQALRH